MIFGLTKIYNEYYEANKMFIKISIFGFFLRFFFLLLFYFTIIPHFKMLTFYPLFTSHFPH